MWKPGLWNPLETTLGDFYSCGYTLMEIAALEEETQISGAVIICDATDFGLNQLRNIAIEDIKFLAMFLQVISRQQKPGGLFKSCRFITIMHTHLKVPAKNSPALLFLSRGKEEERKTTTISCFYPAEEEQSRRIFGGNFQTRAHDGNKAARLKVTTWFKKTCFDTYGDASKKFTQKIDFLLIKPTICGKNKCKGSKSSSNGGFYVPFWPFFLF